MILDYIILISLFVAIFYSWRMNKKIIDLKNTKNELARVMQTFNAAIIKAEQNIEELKQLSEGVSTDIHKKIEKANYLNHDLSFMIDRAAEISENLSNKIALSKKEKIPLNAKIFSAREGSLVFSNDEVESLNINKDTNKIESNIDVVLNKISNIAKNNNDSIPVEKPYKPMITRQVDYFRNLRKI